MGNSDKELSPNYQSNNFNSRNANFWCGSHGFLEKRKHSSMAIYYSVTDVTRNVKDREPASNVDVPNILRLGMLLSDRGM